jgi:hypothetical protein
MNNIHPGAGTVNQRLSHALYKHGNLYILPANNQATAHSAAPDLRDTFLRKSGRVTPNCVTRNFILIIATHLDWLN